MRERKMLRGGRLALFALALLFVFSCSACGEKHTFSEPLEFVCPYGDYETVMAPIQRVMQDILAELNANGKINLSEYRQPMLEEIRFTYGTDLWITISDTMLTAEKGELSQFLEKEIAFSLEDIGENYSEEYERFRTFLNTERSLRNRADYIEKLFPMSAEVAKSFREMYAEYKVAGKTPKIYKFHNTLSLKKDSVASAEYEAIKQRINTFLSIKIEANEIPIKTPLIDNEDIEISFGGNLNDEIVYSNITLKVRYSNYVQLFDPKFNKSGKFSEEYINRFMGYVYTGYDSPFDDIVENEEYPEFFAKVMESLHLRGDIFGTYEGEETFLKMPEAKVLAKTL